MATLNLAKVGAVMVKNAVSGEMVELGTLWKEQISVVFFLRRFGCQICRWTAKEVSKLQESFEQHQIRLVGVGPEDVGLKEFLDGNYFSGGEHTLKGKIIRNHWIKRPFGPLRQLYKQILSFEDTNNRSMEVFHSAQYTNNYGAILTNLKPLPVVFIKLWPNLAA